MTKNILITGGCGFIGCNTALFFKNKGWNVTIFDNLSREGTANNLEWLQREGEFEFIKGDVRNYNELEAAVKTKEFHFVLHLAAQVAVTTSVQNPREDFEINALGTFNLLEATRKYNKDAFVLTASTNKVYGKLDHLEVEQKMDRYEYKSLENGVDENQNLDFHSPYGCSKGAADQYTIDYSKIDNLNTCVFRQSCIYGTRQFGVEDQGWIAWFTIAALIGKPLYIFGDGMQVRDALFVEDLSAAYMAAYENRETVNGQAFNIGGGKNNTLSLLELVKFLKEFLKVEIDPMFAEWRPGDQKVFICDTTKFEKMTGWSPKVSTTEGIGKLAFWVKEHIGMLREITK